MPKVLPSTRGLKQNSEIDFCRLECACKKIEAQRATSKSRSLLQRQIDALVYELYGLTEEEIKIVEESL
jgi:hypothetical protein